MWIFYIASCLFLLFIDGCTFQIHGYINSLILNIGAQKSGIVYIFVYICDKSKYFTAGVGHFLIKTNSGQFFIKDEGLAVWNHLETIL